jgi:hypothetical protein
MEVPMKRKAQAVRRERLRKARINEKNQRIVGVTFSSLDFEPEIKLAVPKEVISSAMRNRTKSVRNRVKQSLRPPRGITVESVLDHEFDAPRDLTPKEFKSVLIDWMRETPFIVSVNSTQ